MATHQHTLSRRAALGAIGVATSIAAIPLVATAQIGNPDAAILAALERSKEARRRYSALPLDGHHEEERALERAYDEADQLICDTTAVTDAGIAAKLWVSLIHSENDMWFCDAMRNDDYATLAARAEELNFDTRLAFAAFMTLRGRA